MRVRDSVKTNENSKPPRGSQPGKLTYYFNKRKQGVKRRLDKGEEGGGALKRQHCGRMTTNVH